MKAIPTRCALAAAFVCSLAPAAAGVSPASAVAFQLPTAEIVIQGSGLESTYQKEATPFKESLWVRGSLFAGGGFFTGFLAFRLLRRRTARNMWLVAGASFLIPGTPAAHACINVEENTLEETYRDYTDTGWFTGTVRNALRANPAKDPHLTANPAAYKTTPRPGTLESDEAARMIIRGDAAGALVKLREIEAAHPGLYQTAANMGTAYELTGDDAQALQWIKTGIERNPHSHMNAEWLHVKILEAKIALKKDPGWLETHTITGFDPKKSSLETLQGEKSTREVLESMRSQATVRALFIKPTDVILSHLLKEAAVLALTASPGSTPGLVELAEEYGLSKTLAAEVRQEFDRRKVAAINATGASEARIFLWEYWPWLLFGVFAIVGAYVAVRSGRKRNA